MPLTTGSIYLFGQILSFALPVGLLLTLAYIFTRQAIRMPPNPKPPVKPAAPSAPAPDSVGQPAPAPSPPYSDL